MPKVKDFTGVRPSNLANVVGDCQVSGGTPQVITEPNGTFTVRCTFADEQAQPQARGPMSAAPIEPPIQPADQLAPASANEHGIAKPAAGKPRKMVVTADNLNVRESGGLDAKVTSVLRRGDIVTVLASSPDGVWQKVTADGIDGWASFKFLQPVMDGVVVSPFRWFDIAMQELGVAELQGEASNPRVVEYLQSTNLPAPLNANDATPWCSAFVNYCVEKAGFEGTNSAGARSWLNWGRATDQPPVGAIVVFERGDPPSGHVAFLMEDVGDGVKVLGGNQGNRVSIQLFKKKKKGANLLSYRIPG
jgi:uncharacterized protein (TIGR02594 family)